MPQNTGMIARERLALMELMDEGEFRIPRRELDENILIATWNIQNLGERHDDRALQYMADIIERFDIVAIQEVKSCLTSLAALKALLPGNYDILVSDVTGNYERFAFLFDKRTVRPTGLVAEIGFRVPGATHMGYQLHRMPYCASFKAGRFDFVLVNVHIYFGRSGSRHLREQEIAVLADHLIKQSKKHRNARVFDPDFFVVGDFNIKKYGDQFFAALSRTFDMPPQMDDQKTNWKQTGTYDKIAWRRASSFSFSGQCNVVPFQRVLFQDQPDPGGLREMSDHLPLWAEFRVNELTQELNAVIR